MSKRILSLVLALVMVLGTFGTVFAAEPSGNEKVDWLVEEGLVLGDAGGLRLADPISRAEVATMVVRALDLEDVAKASAGFASSFTDMNAPGVVWARGHVTVAAGKGIVNGYLNGEFRPANDITYAEVAAMMVRVLGGLTEAEEKTAVWPTTYLAKAVQLGVFQGVEGIADYNAPATREKMFEMVYNAIVNKEFGNYTIVKGIVLENNRVEALDSNEVVVEVIRELQRADYAEESRLEKGDQENFVIDAKVGNVENLLGKVADFTLDKNGKVVKVTVDETYKVIEGPLKATKSKVEMDRDYTVELDERYKGTDERIFRTYHNDKDFKYEDFYRDVKEVDYARVTVKNGKVLFIDAFTFEDIAPVQEVKKDGAEVYVYNDNRDARIEKYAPTSVVGYTEEDGFNRIEKADIKANDVVHVYRTNRMIVRQDSLVEGTYEKVSEGTINKFYAHIDGTKYLMNSATLRKPVYSYDSKAFMTLEANKATSLLRDFRDEEVTALIDINSDLQYFGSAIEFNEGMAMIDEVLSRGDVRFVKPSNDKVVLSETFDSEFEINGTTRNNNLKDFNRGDLVFLENDGDDIASMFRLATAQGINTAAKLVNKPTATSFEMSENYIRLAGEAGRYNVLPRTNVFLLTMDGSKADTLTGTTITKIRSNIDLDSNTLRAYVITDKQIFDANLGRTLISNKIDVAHTIVFVDHTAVAASYDYETIRVTERFVAGRDRQIVGRDQYGDSIVRDVHRTVTTDYSIGDIVRLGITKDDDKVVRRIDARIAHDAKTFKVNSMSSHTGYRSLELVDAKGVTKTLWTLSNVIEFGRVAKDDLISIWTTNDFNDIGVIKVVGTGNPTATFDGSDVVDPATGVVTYINALGVIEIDGVVHTITDTTVLRNELGIIEQTGKANIGGALTMNVDKVFDVVADSNKVISSMKYVANAGQKTMAEDTIEMINDLDSTKATFAADVLAARTKYNTVSAFPKVKNLIPASVVAKLVAAEAKLTAAADANTFKTVTAVTILAKTVDTVVVGDKPAIDNALTAYGSLSNDAKALLTAEKLLLDGMKAKVDPLADAATVVTAKGNLTIAGDLNDVQANLTLAATQDTATVTWASSNTAIVANDGTVTRPNGANVQVNLTATITKGASTDTKVFVVTVTAQ